MATVWLMNLNGNFGHMSAQPCQRQFQHTHHHVENVQKYKPKYYQKTLQKCVIYGDIIQ